MSKRIALLSVLLLACTSSAEVSATEQEAAEKFCRDLQVGADSICVVDADKKLISIKRRVYGETELPDCGKVADMGNSVFPTKAGWTLTIDVDADGRRQSVSCVFD